MHVTLMFPSKYLKAIEFQNRDITMTIKGVVMEDLQEANGGVKKKGVVAFDESPRLLILNRTNALCLAAMFGNETDAWVGKKVTLYPAPFRDPFSGENTVAIRVRGSPDIAKDMNAEIRLPRKNPIRMALRKTGGKNLKPNGKTAKEPDATPEPPPDDAPPFDSETGEVFS